MMARILGGRPDWPSDFLLQTDRQAAKDIADLIIDALEMLVQHPRLAKKFSLGNANW
ncbi:MAG: hypothetical protein IPN53_04180 [Comamonadaceae bacterium]|nr:hypothetical protein [Comamonadaceae bacterium]